MGKKKNLHITLIPPWPEADIEKIKLLLSKPLDIKSFNMNFERVIYGPGCGARPRMIWAEGQVPGPLLKLKEKLENILGTNPGDRGFTLHLTLARFRQEDFVRFPVKKLDEKIFWTQKVSDFALVESDLLPEGARYTVIKRTPLL